MSDGDIKRQWVRRVLGVVAASPVAGKGPAGARLAGLETRFRDAARADPEARSRLDASMAMARELVAVGDDARATIVLNRLEAIMSAPAEAGSKPTLPTTERSYYDLIADKGQLVAYRRALLAWDTAKKDARGQLDGLKQSIARSAPSLGGPAEIVDRVMTRLGDDLAHTVDAAMNADDLGTRARHHRHAAELARDYLMRVNFDPVFKAVDSNPVQPLNLRGVLSNGLSQVIAALPA